MQVCNTGVTDIFFEGWWERAVALFSFLGVLKLRKDVLCVRLDCDELERFEKLQKVWGMSSRSEVLRKLILDVQVGVQIEQSFEQEVRERLEKLEMNVERLLKGFGETPQSVQVEHRKSNGKKLIGGLTEEQKAMVRVSTIRKIADILGVSTGKAHTLKKELREIETGERQGKLF